jgi:hypothetical protein
LRRTHEAKSKNGDKKDENEWRIFLPHGPIGLNNQKVDGCKLPECG